MTTGVSCDFRVFLVNFYLWPTGAHRDEFDLVLFLHEISLAGIALLVGQGSITFSEGLAGSCIASQRIAHVPRLICKSENQSVNL